MKTAREILEPFKDYIIAYDDDGADKILFAMEEYTTLKDARIAELENALKHIAWHSNEFKDSKGEVNHVAILGSLAVSALEKGEDKK